MAKFPPAEYKNHYIFYPEMTPNFSVPRLGNKSFTITADIDWKPGDEGVLVGAGTNSGGYTLYIENGHLCFYFNYLQNRSYDLISDKPLIPGKHAVTFDFMNTGENCGIGRLLVDGLPGSAAVKINTEPLFPVAGYFAVGRYGESPIHPAHKGKGYYKYTGVFDRVEYNLDRPEDDMDRMFDMHVELTNQ